MLAISSPWSRGRRPEPADPCRSVLTLLALNIQVGQKAPSVSREETLVVVMGPADPHVENGDAVRHDPHLGRIAVDRKADVGILAPVWKRKHNPVCAPRGEVELAAIRSEEGPRGQLFSGPGNRGATMDRQQRQLGIGPARTVREVEGRHREQTAAEMVFERLDGNGQDAPLRVLRGICNNPCTAFGNESVFASDKHPRFP